MNNQLSTSEKIFNLLAERGISQRELSKRTGIPTSTICDWRRKGNVPMADKISLVCKALQVRPEDILDDIGSYATDIAVLGEGDVVESSGKDADSDVRIVRKGEPMWDIIETFEHMEAEQQERMIKYFLAYAKEK